MTYQVKDSVRVDGRELQLAGYFNGREDEDLFNPQSIDLEIGSISSACWRGYRCDYAVVDGRLVLQHLGVSLGGEDREAAMQGRGPRRFGRLPVEGPPLGIGHWHYQDLAEPLDFTGKLVVMGAPPDEPDGSFYLLEDPIDAEVLLELFFDRGELLSRVDLSATAAQLSARIDAIQREEGFDCSDPHWHRLMGIAEQLFDRKIRRSEWDYGRPEFEPTWWDEQTLRGGRDLF